MKTSIMKIGGMHCGGCVGSVEKALRQVQGLQSASVSLEAGEATVTYDPARASLADFTQAVSSAGYSVSTNTEPASTHPQAGHCGSSIDRPKGGCCCS
jgi:copper chaperone CopZ